MLNDDQILTGLDFAWVLLFVIGAVLFCLSANFAWIRRPILLTFVLSKFALCVGFSVWAIDTNQEFDSATHYLLGLDYAQLFRELLSGDSFEYLHATPFFGVDGISSDRFRSLLGMLTVLSGGSFMACSLSVCSLGAVGQLLIFKYLRQRFPNVRAFYFLLVLFHPSLSLWSGLLLKDTLGIFALGLIIYHTDKLFINLRVMHALGALAGAYLAYQYRSFILIMALVILLFIAWDRKFKQMAVRNPIVTFFYVYCALIVSTFGIVYYVLNYGRDMVDIQQGTNLGYSQIEAGSTFNNAELSYSLGGLLALPVGVMNALLRPFIWEPRKLNQALAALENFFVVGLVVRGWFAYAYEIGRDARRAIRSVFWGFAIVTLVCASGVGLFSSNLGSISRYRIPLIPLFVAGPCLALGIRARARSGWADVPIQLRPKAPISEPTLQQ